MISTAKIIILLALLLGVIAVLFVKMNRGVKFLVVLVLLVLSFFSGRSFFETPPPGTLLEEDSKSMEAYELDLTPIGPAKTFRLNGKKVSFTPVRFANFEAMVSESDELHRKFSHLDYADRFEAVEKVLLEKYSDFLSREGEKIYVQPTRGGTFVLRAQSEEEEPDVVDRVYGHHIEEVDLTTNTLFLREYHYEWLEYLLVNLENGEKTYVPGPVYFSPHKTKAVATSYFQMTGPEARVVLYTTFGSKLVEEWSFGDSLQDDPEEWANFGKVIWLDEETFLLEVVFESFNRTGVNIIPYLVKL